jgi:hypothetical protein
MFKTCLPHGPQVPRVVLGSDISEEQMVPSRLDPRASPAAERVVFSKNIEILKTTHLMMIVE